MLQVAPIDPVDDMAEQVVRNRQRAFVQDVGVFALVAHQTARRRVVRRKRQVPGQPEPGRAPRRDEFIDPRPAVEDRANGVWLEQPEDLGKAGFSQSPRLPCAGDGPDRSRQLTR